MSTFITLSWLIPANIASYFVCRWCIRNPDWGYYYFGAWTLFGTGAAAYYLATSGLTSNFWWSAVCAAVNFFNWWFCRKRRKRRRATELAGYKAKAALEKIAAKQRESAQRRPVLSPIPEQQ